MTDYLNAINNNQASEADQQRHWPAWIALGFDQARGKTRMNQMQFAGPLRVQRPFYPEGETSHVYLLHPPGGLVSGDDLHIQVDCQPQSHALLTTPSAGKIYQADSANIEQKQRVDISVDNAKCEWLPMETIVFDGAHGFLNTQINLYGDARFIGMDVFCLGRTHSGLPFEQGMIEQSFNLYHNDKPLLLDRQRLGSQDPLIEALVGFNNCTVSGTLVAFGADAPEQQVEQLRQTMTDIEEERCISITQRLDLILVRYLGNCSEQAQRLLRQCWHILRPAIIDKAPCVPRIWNT
ncbi:urease accessory protein UreD [Neiella sp. HB171785]|uniref:Urease accessory protein UreD n=1 Tax=Neiella litorisoli TaxID=2771431 RepID=A0A8J6UL54_9GAMM|nr:urease accessory protein UreD [Neiella litorisoli]MBD1388320.1 urease accessory protein UreD [Neiella litorisoli]